MDWAASKASRTSSRAHSSMRLADSAPIGRSSLRAGDEPVALATEGLVLRQPSGVHKTRTDGQCGVRMGEHRRGRIGEHGFAHADRRWDVAQLQEGGRQIREHERIILLGVRTQQRHGASRIVARGRAARAHARGLADAGGRSVRSAAASSARTDSASFTLCRWASIVASLNRCSVVVASAPLRRRAVRRPRSSAMPCTRAATSRSSSALTTRPSSDRHASARAARRGSDVDAGIASASCAINPRRTLAGIAAVSDSASHGCRGSSTTVPSRATHGDQSRDLGLLDRGPAWPAHEPSSRAASARVRPAGRRADHRVRPAIPDLEGRLRAEACRRRERRRFPTRIRSDATG